MVVLLMQLPVGQPSIHLPVRLLLSAARLADCRAPASQIGAHLGGTHRRALLALSCSCAGAAASLLLSLPAGTQPFQKKSTNHKSKNAERVHGLAPYASWEVASIDLH